MTVNGYQNFFCNGEYYRVTRGGVIQINPDESHDGFAEDDTGFTYFMLYVPRPLLKDAIHAYTTQEISDFRFADTVVAHTQLRTRLFDLIQHMKFRTQDPLHIEELFLKMVGSLVDINILILKPNTNPSKQDSLILQAQEYIRNHLNQHISLDDLSRTVNISKYHFVRLFKQFN